MGSQNLINEYKERIGKIKKIIDGIYNADDINTILSSHPQIMGKMWDLCWLLDLVETTLKEESAEIATDDSPVEVSIYSANTANHSKSFMKDLIEFDKRKENKEGR